MLEYQNAIFLDIFEEDGLLVMAKGLGLEIIVLNLLKVYSDRASLILVIGASQKEESYFIRQLEFDDVNITLPKTVTAECAAADRNSLYLQGGILFVTSRILVVDMLKNTLPIESIDGILVLRAHKVIDSCQEAFILRLFREENKFELSRNCVYSIVAQTGFLRAQAVVFLHHWLRTGFIKGFTSNSEAFAWGFCKVERVMRNLFVKKLFLWPRFHATVNSSLECHKPEGVEIQLSLTKPMLAIQMALLDLITVCVRELKSCNPTLDLENVTADNAISKAFDKIVRFQLEPIWHQLSLKTIRLINDLRELRTFLNNLTVYDCVTFYNVVKSLRTAENVMRNPGWVFLPPADALFLHSKERIFEATDQKTNTGKDKLRLEENPKWVALKEILTEVLEETKKQNAVSPVPIPILIVAADDRMCDQLQEVLSEGSNTLLHRLCEKYLNCKPPAVNKRKKTDSDKKNDVGIITLTQIMRFNDGSDGEKSDEAASNVAGDNLSLVTDPMIIIQPLRDSMGLLGVSQTLNKFKPRFIIIHDMDMAFVRQLEVYKASNPDIPVVAYFLVFDSSAEEQKYLNVLRREKEAFEMLIRQKGSMVIPEERDGRIDGHPDLERDPRKANETVNSALANTRKGGLDQDSARKIQQKIIVDMREFRSELPSLIHRRGIDIEPVTLEVGDYILTPDICVERKSVDDLIGSLNNGRLYSQATAMCRYYKKPMLLIEFNPEKPFILQGKYGMSGQVSSHDSTSKLMLLTLHFPKLKILWCSSPHATAEIFDELKVGKEQPSAVEAMKITEAVSGEMGTDLITGKYNPGPKAFLNLLPGVDSKNCRLLMNRTGSLHELCTNWSQERLYELLVNTAAAKFLWESFHISPKQTTEQAKNPQNKGAYNKWKRKY